MNMRKEYLRQRREFLVLQAAAQRDEVACVSSRLQHDLRLVDTIFAVGQAVRAVPLLAMATTFLIMRTPRHKSLLWIGRLLTAWQLFVMARKTWQQH